MFPYYVSASCDYDIIKHFQCPLAVLVISIPSIVFLYFLSWVALTILFLFNKISSHKSVYVTFKLLKKALFVRFIHKCLCNLCVFWKGKKEFKKIIIVIVLQVVTTNVYENTIYLLLLVSFQDHIVFFLFSSPIVWPICWVVEGRSLNLYLVIRSSFVLHILALCL